MHPTDIDAVMEFDGKKLILIEYKTKGNTADTGQKLLLERIADNWKSKEGNDSIIIYCEHEQYDPNEDVDGGNAIVTGIYWQKRRISYAGLNRTVRDIVWSFAHKEIIKKLERESCIQLKSW